MTSNRYYQTIFELASLYDHVANDGDKKLVDFITERAPAALKKLEEASDGVGNTVELISDIMKRVENTVRSAGGDEMSNLKTALSQALTSYVRATQDEEIARNLMTSAVNAGRRQALGATAAVMLANSVAAKNPDQARAIVRQVAQRLAVGPSTVDAAGAVKKSGVQPTYKKTRSGGLVYAHESVVEAIDLGKARETAHSWHSGMSSGLYSFASTGKVWNEDHKQKLMQEIRASMEWAQKNDPQEVRKLQNLLTLVQQTVVQDDAGEQTTPSMAESMTAGAVATTAAPLFTKPRKRIKVKEDKAIFDVSVTYEIVTPESAANSDAEERGFVVQNQRMGLADMMRLVQEYGILPRHRGDLTQWWSSEPQHDYRTGHETTYSLHVKINGKRLDNNQFDRIDGVIARTMRMTSPAPAANAGVVPESKVSEGVNDLDLRFLPADAVAWLVNQPEPLINAAKEVGVAAHEIGNPIVSGAVLRADTSVLVLHDSKNKATIHVYPDGGISADGQPLSGHEDVERILGDIPPGQTSADVKPEGDCGCDDAGGMDSLATPMQPKPEEPVVAIDVESPMTFDELSAI